MKIVLALVCVVSVLAVKIAAQSSDNPAVAASSDSPAVAASSDSPAVAASSDSPASSASSKAPSSGSTSKPAAGSSGGSNPVQSGAALPAVPLPINFLLFASAALYASKRFI